MDDRPKDFSNAASVRLKPALGKTRLIVNPDDREVLSYNRETDAHGALSRGLKEYLEQLSMNWQGRLIQFSHVFDDWATTEDDADYPAAAMIATEQGMYDASKLTPSTIAVNATQIVRSVSEFQVPMTIVAVATDPVAREGMAAMLEDALNPVDWMYGVRLELPHYFSTRCTIEPLGSRYLDDPELAQRRRKPIIFYLTGTVVQYRQAGMLKHAEFVPKVEVGPDQSLKVQ